MADIITTLHPENNPNDNLYPNIKKENIPDNAIDIDMLDRDVDYVVATTKNNAIGKYNVTMQNGYLTPQGVYLVPEQYHSISSILIPCNEGDVFYYKGKAPYSSNAYAIFYDELGVRSSVLTTINSPNSYVEVIVPTNAKYVKFSSYDAISKDVVYDVYKKDSVYNGVINNDDKLKALYGNIGKYNVTMQNGFLTPQGFYLAPEQYHSISSVLIPCNEGDVFYYKGNAAYSSNACAIFYDELRKIIGNRNTVHSLNNYTEIVIPTNAKYVKFSSYDVISKDVVYDVYKKDSVYNYVVNNSADIISLQSIANGNILFGKKYVACGDSFTEYGKNDNTSYPQYIANRNAMNLVNLAKSGSYSHYDDTSNSFTNPNNYFYYQNIPLDADYISIAYGLNETGAVLGDYTSSDNTTIWGAFNEILNWIITNIPQAKILIISNDAWFTYSLRNTMRDIAHYWGVGFLDLKGSEVPLMIDGKYSQDGYNVNPHAVELYNNYYKLSSTDSHPNENGRKARSTIIESALRKL